MLLDRIESTSVRVPFQLPDRSPMYLDRYHHQRKFSAITRRVHRRSQQRDQIAVVDGLAFKGPVEENLHADIKHRVRSRHARQLLPAANNLNLADRLERLIGLEDGVLVEEPVIVRGKPERLARSAVPGQERAVGGQVEGGGVEELRRGQVGGEGEDHDLEIAVAASSGAVDEEIVPVEVGARARRDEVEVG